MSQNIRIDLKILVVGCSGTGKTSFVRRWTQGKFKDSYLPTVVSEFGFKIYQSNEKFYRIQLWDIGGQDKSLTMAKIFSRDSHGCVVVSDSTDFKTLEDTLNWKNIVSEEAEFIDGGKIPFILVQNKIDLIGNREDFNKIENDTKKISEDNNFNKYFMTSVKKNINVEESMTFLIEKIIEKLEECASNGNIVFNEQKIKNTIKIDNNNERKKENIKCC
jgi:small GTP-binding protein